MSHEPAGVQRSSVRINVPAVAACLAGFAFLIWAHAIPHGLGHELVRDLGIALIVSALIYAFIESHIHVERERETKAALITELFGNMVDPAVWDDLTARILASGIVCDKWSLEVAISKKYVTPDQRLAMPGAQPGDQFVSRGIQRYTLRNCSKTNLEVPLRHELQFIVAGHADGSRIPRFIRFVYTKREGASVVQTKLIESQLVDSGIWGGQELLEKKVRLEPGGSIDVELEREEVVDVPGEFPWYVFWLTRTPRLKVQLPSDGEVTCHVLLRHHQAVEWQCDAEGAWVLPTVFLPGQGFAIMTRFAEG